MLKNIIQPQQQVFLLNSIFMSTTEISKYSNKTEQTTFS